MSKDQVLRSETSAPPEKPKDQEEIPGYQKSTRSQIVVTANGQKVKSSLNPNASEFYPTWILPKVDKGEGGNANLVVKDKFSIETLEKFKRPCHYAVVQETIHLNDSWVEIIERPEKGLKLVTNVVVEEIIERKFSEDFEKRSTNRPNENEEGEEFEKCKETIKMMESIKTDKVELINNGEKTLNSMEILVKCKEDEESIHKQVQIEETIDPQVLFFGPATVKQTESSTDLKQNSSHLEISTKIETVDEVIDDGRCSDNAIIENTVVGDHTEAKMDVQINKVSENQMKKDHKLLDAIAPTSTTKIKDKTPSSRIALSGTLKAVSRTTTANNMKSTGTVKKLLNSSTAPTTKETKVVFSAATARSLITPRPKPQSTLEAKKSETIKNITPSTNPAKLSTNTKKTSLQSRSSLTTSNNFIKKDVLAKSKTKDSISLRSTCSTDKNSLSSKSSSLSSTAKVTSSKMIEKSLSKPESTKPTVKTGVQKRTDYLTRSPGGTVSSNLRKTETQKRQNLFPDSDAIKMTDVLFK